MFFYPSPQINCEYWRFNFWLMTRLVSCTQTAYQIYSEKQAFVKNYYLDWIFNFKSFCKSFFTSELTSLEPPPSLIIHKYW